MYEDGNEALLKGCDDCHGKLFFFIKKERLDELKNYQEKLTTEDKKKIESDVLDILGEEKVKENPVVLDFETIRVLKPGHYELDLVQLFKEDPLIFKLEEGKYFIDVVASFDSFNKKKKEQQKE
jgi:predicted  nucleic acid-binding Zn-ribbon protein